MAEYYHDDDEVAQTAGGVVPFSGSGTTLGGGGGGGGAGGLALGSGGGGGGMALGGGQLLGGVTVHDLDDSDATDEDDGGPDPGRCGVCGAAVPPAAMALHMARHERSGDLQRHRERQAREAELRRQQQEYDASLAEDTRREREEQEQAELEKALEASRAEAEAEEARRKAAEKAAAEAAAAAAEVERKRKREGLAAEPAAGTGGAVTLKVRLPNGMSVTRRFAAGTMMAEVYAWLASLDALAGCANWTLHPPMGHSVEGELAPTDETLEELGLSPSAMCHVRDEDA